MDHETHCYNFNNTLQEKMAGKNIAEKIEILIMSWCWIPVTVVVYRQAPCIQGYQQKDELIEPTNNE
jgi:hypothetical protein